MKKFAFILSAIAAIAMFSCNKGSDKTVVKGTIKNADNNMIYLSMLKGQNETKLDSTRIADDGSFSMEAKLQHARFLYMGNVQQRNYIQLVGKPGDQITLKANMQDLGRDYTIKGSEASKEVRYVSNLLMRTNKKIDSLRSNFENTKQGKPKKQINSLYQQNQGQIRKVAQNFYDKKTQFIDNHLGRLSSMVGLSGLKFQEYFEYYQKVDSALMANYPNNPEVKNFHKFVERRSKEVQAQRESSKKLQKGKVAPDFTLKNPDKQPRSLSDLKGKYVLLDFWASWCKPCRQESPNLVENYKKFSDEGFEIFQVSLDRERQKWLEAIKEDNLSRWYHVYDANNKVAEMYNIRAIPTNYLLNKKGKIVAKNLRGQRLGQYLSNLFE